MATVQGVLDVARSQLGVRESPPGSNRVMYNDWAGVVPGPWCAAFVCWVLDQAGALDVPRFVWTPAGAQAYQERGRWDHQASIGDVVFFTWPGSPRICHVGLVEAVRSDGGVTTIEGNTDEKGGGTGGKVMRHVRRANMTGFGQPIYDAVAPATPQAPAIPIGLAKKPLLKLGSRGAAVAEMQRVVGAVPDGVFGPNTRAAVIRYQTFRGLVPDGVVGPKTWAAMG